MITLNSILLSVVFTALSGPNVYLRIDPTTQINPQLLQEEVAARLGEYSVTLKPPSTGANFTVTINPAENSPNSVVVEISSGSESILKRITSVPAESIPAARQLAVLIEGPIRRASKSLKEMVPVTKPKPKSPPKPPPTAKPRPASKPAPKTIPTPAPPPTKPESTPAQVEKPSPPEENDETEKVETAAQKPEIRSEIESVAPRVVHLTQFDVILGLGYLPESQTSFPITGLGIHHQWLPYLGTGFELDFAFNTSRGVSSLPLTSHEMGAALLLSSSLRLTALNLRAAVGPLMVLDIVSPENSFSFGSAAQILLLGSRGYVEARMPLMDDSFEWILRIEGDFLPKSPRYTWRGAPVESRGPFRLSAHLGISFPIMD